MAYLSQDGGRGLRTVIWSRLEALLQRHRTLDSSIVMRAVVDGDITGPTTDNLTVVVSHDRDPGLIGSLALHAGAVLVGVVSAGTSVIRSYDGLRTYIELVAKLFPRVSVLCSRVQ